MPLAYNVLATICCICCMRLSLSLFIAFAFFEFSRAFVIVVVFPPRLIYVQLITHVCGTISRSNFYQAIKILSKREKYRKWHTHQTDTHSHTHTLLTHSLAYLCIIFRVIFLWRGNDALATPGYHFYVPLIYGQRLHSPGS